ncbi:ParA family protein [Azospirillum rugosum]|uniref:ParA family protein n=1 Tax=Azospirillum rugosum TaxID=416170 RepID=UPI00361288E5
MATDVLEPEAAGSAQAEAPARATKRLLIASPKGGATKTSTTRNLAVIAALSGLNVAVLDLDSQKSLTKWWGKRPSNAVRIEHYEGSMDDVEGIDEIDGHDLVVIDTPPLVEERPEAVRALTRAAHLTLVPTLQGVDDVDSVIGFMRFLKQEKADAVFLLGATNRRAASYEKAKRRLIAAGRLCAVDVPRYEDIQNAAEVGLGVAEVRRAKGVEDFMAVWNFVRGELGI